MSNANLSIDAGLNAKRVARWPSPKQKAICVAIVGPGGVGSTLLEQWHHIQPQLMMRSTARLELRALCNSSHMLLAAKPIDVAAWQQALAHSTSEPNLGDLNLFLRQQDDPVVVIDVSASESVSKQHAHWLRCGYTVLTANKYAAASASRHYSALRHAEAVGGGRYLCETTVGAGLPLIGLISDLVRTGDEVLKIEGILSGTLSHLLARLEVGEAFADVLRDLHSCGYTEPDPRHDLSGLDVARKLVILGRTADIKVDLDDVSLTSCAPIGDQSTESVVTFLERCDQYNQVIGAQVSAARRRNSVLRYVATIERGGRAVVAPTVLAHYHPMARLPAGDNLIRITTKRYQISPLVIQGAGAGREVTAAGLLADLIRCASR